MMKTMKVQAMIQVMSFFSKSRPRRTSREGGEGNRGGGVIVDSASIATEQLEDPLLFHLHLLFLRLLLLLAVVRRPKLFRITHSY